MNEDEYYRVRTNLHSGRNAPRRQNGGNKGGHMGFLRFQLFVCVLSVAAAGVIRLAGGDLYIGARHNVSGALNEPVTSSQIKQTLAAIKNGLPDVSGVFASSQIGTVSSVSAGSSAASASGSAVSGASASTASSQAKTSSNTASAASK